MPDHGYCVNPHRYCIAIAVGADPGRGHIVRDETIAISSCVSAAHDVCGDAS
jgi:hypothetical protein